MRKGNSKIKSLWLGVLFVILITAMCAVFMSGNSQREPGKTLVYRLDEKYLQVDPSLIIFDETGRIEPGLKEVKALAADNDGKIYVAGPGSLIVCDLEGTQVASFEIDGDPQCISIAPDGQILLGLRNEVKLLSLDSDEKSSWPISGEKTYITSIAAGENDVYVADAGNRVVLHFDRAGKMLGKIGKEDAKRDIPGFIIPSPFFDVALDDQGSLWVVNPGLHGLEQYRKNGDLVTSWYKPSMMVEGFCGCCNPMHVAFRQDGSLITAEKGLARVKLYDAAWSFKGLVAPPDAFPSSAAGLNTCDDGAPIEDVAVDSRNRVLVLDPQENAIRIFEEKENV